MFRKTDKEHDVWPPSDSPPKLTHPYSNQRFPVALTTTLEELIHEATPLQLGKASSAHREHEETPTLGRIWDPCGVSATRSVLAQKPERTE